MIESKLGDMMLVINKPDSALYYYNLVLNNTNPSPNNWEKTYVFLGLAKIDLLENNLNNAEKNGLLAFEYLKKKHS